MNWDIRGLFRTLWAGKLWIIGMGLAFALIALAYTFFARQEWSSTGDYRSSNGEYAGGILLTAAIFGVTWMSVQTWASADQPSVMDEAYKEFVMQLASWDTRREFLAANRLLQAADGGQQQSRCGVAG
ncbi:enterobacterial common antigen (ECA) polysaccharide chain length modulation protein [Escherichia coli]|uniref:Enterobacterial common antigen (ECA) polysaccharide chain length modulation protein n=1 Tax=Escherichia coli TaxID=562 RepID=A0A3S4JVU8_ECOLX|nr:enterobacterial common antigen (ECA) polysaccharide chain length modulation protein [Escherichia coli]